MKKLFIFCSLLIIPMAFAKTPVPDDFAFGFALEVDGDGALYELTLPQSVYENITSTRLEDVRVFNSHDLEVPRIIQRPVLTRREQLAPVSIPFYPLYIGKQKTNAMSSIHITTDDKGTIIDISDARPTGKQDVFNTYLLDLSALKHLPEELRIEWQQGKKHFVGTIKIEASDDLTHWRMLRRKTTLADINYGGHRLFINHIKMVLQKVKYLRFSWSETTDMPAFTKIMATFPEEVLEQPRQWLNISGKQDPKEQGVYEFDSGAFLPTDRIDIKLPQRNTLVNVKLLSRVAENDAWQIRHTGILYDLSIDNNEIKSDTIILSVTSDRFWRLEVDVSGGGLGSGLPQLSLGWLPHKMIFVARGQAPFKVVYGSTEEMPSTLVVKKLLFDVDNKRNGNYIKAAKIASRLTLGGKEKLLPPRPPVPWKKWSLWFVLILGVVVLAWMAIRLYKQMDAEKEAE